jgi:hypothetical protein
VVIKIHDLKNIVVFSLVSIAALGLSSCGTSDEGGGSNHPFEGTWTGTVNCSGTQVDDGTTTNISGTDSVQFKFDDSGSLLLTLGGAERALEEQGQEITTQESSGAILQTTATTRTVSDTAVTFVVDSVSDDTDASASGSSSVHAESRMSIEMTLGSDPTKASLTLQILSEDTATVSSGAGSAISTGQSDITCTGELSVTQ